MSVPEPSAGKSPYTDGDIIGERYQILAEVGRGATSDVYKAKDLRDGPVVALKIMNTTRLRDPVARQRFHREASVQAMIQHPNVATILGDGVTTSNEPYLVLELFAGRCLRTALNEVARLDLSTACAYALQALEGLAACHAVGVRHRDLKPENIMMRAIQDDLEQLVLIDFGFAALIGQERLTSDGYVVGSMSYISPERLLGEPGDARADVYAMGVVFFELLTGSKPFAGDQKQLACKHLEEDPPSPREVAPDAGISVGIEAVALTALAKDPAARYQSAREMAEALSRVAVARTTQSYSVAKAPPEALLVYCDVDGIERSCSLGTEAIEIGRAPECAIRSQDPLVSRHHARITVGDDGQYWIEDLESTNGVYLGVERTARAALPYDDLILVGSLVLQLRPTAQDDVVAKLRSGVHTRMWSWLRAARATRAALEDERDALGHRLAELHQAVERLSGDPQEQAAELFADELRMLREDVGGLQDALAVAQEEGRESAAELSEARRALSKAIETRMAESFAAQSQIASLADELHQHQLDSQDLKGRLGARTDELRGMRQDLEAMAQEATLNVGEETLALIEAQTSRARLRERVIELEDLLANQKCELEDALASEPNPVDATQLAELSAELAELRQSQTKSVTAAARLRVQLDMAMTELKTRGAERGHAARPDQDRLVEAQATLQVLREHSKTSDSELVRLREQLIGARAEAEAAWAEVEHLRDVTGGN